VGDQQFSVREGEMVYVADRERNALVAAAGGELHFLQINAPGEFNTVWTEAGKGTTWRATGLDIKGRLPQSDHRVRLGASYWNVG
jgi:hypothetical protein